MTGCPAEPNNGKATPMAKHSNAASMPNAGKIYGITLKKPRETFPVLERDGVKVVFSPAWNNDGNCVGWSIDVLNPIADALAAVDGALEITTQMDTSELWDDLIPTFRRGAECILQLGCPAPVIRKFIRLVKRNGFKIVADDAAKTKGGAA